MACLMAARLGAGLLPPLALAPAVSAERAHAARAWLASLTLPASLRAPLARAIDASAKSSGECADALRAIIALPAAALDAASRSELERLARALADA